MKSELEEKVLQTLLDHKLHISFVESCTGGLMAASLINVPGASGVIEQSFITYSNAAKHKMVGVSEEILDRFGAVSSETAIEMAKGGALVSQSDICVSATGVAGPDAEEGKPVGTVYIGIYMSNSGKDLERAYECHFKGSRQEIRMAAVQRAFEIILEVLSG
ncbi:MAG: CinA family protein [Lachnospiraceae bacterium]